MPDFKENIQNISSQNSDQQNHNEKQNNPTETNFITEVKRACSGENCTAEQKMGCAKYLQIIVP